MKYVCVIHSLGGKTSVEFDSYDKAYQYGLEYVFEVDWTASFEVREKKA